MARKMDKDKINYVSNQIINDEYCFPFYLFYILRLYGKTHISCLLGREDAKV
jgi:hypothetical protein